MENNLPKGWAISTLQELCNMVYGKGLLTKFLTEDGYPVFGANGIIGKYSKYIYEKPQVIISCRGAASGVVHKTVPFAFVTSNSIVLQLNSNEIDLDYFKSSLVSVDRTKIVTGSAQPQITIENLNDLEIPIAPLPEQQRIVSKLEAVMQKVESNNQRLEKIPVILKRFRQSVLAAAVSGKLTEEWRKENTNVESAKTKITKKKSRTILDDKSKDYELFDLPAKWNWQTISDVADVKGGKRIPKGDKLVEQNTGLPYIKAGDIKNGNVLQNKLEYLLPITQAKIKNYIVATGDILITNVGACIGDIGIVPSELNNANQTENALKLCNHEGVYNFYLCSWLQSPIAQDFIRQTVLSAAQGKLALGRVEVFPIPLPPTEEQKEIVKQVEKLFAFADKLEARYMKAKTMIDKLPQSILAKAFRGELVAQDPNDEPASVLLERIKKEKEKLAAEKKGKKSKEYSIEERPLKIAAEGKAKYKKTKV